MIRRLEESCTAYRRSKHLWRQQSISHRRFIELNWVEPSMEHLAGISEPQVPSNEQKDKWIQFSICVFSFNRRKAISPIESWINRWKIEFIDIFAHLDEHDVLTCVPNFPYWNRDLVKEKLGETFERETIRLYIRVNRMPWEVQRSYHFTYS